MLSYSVNEMHLYILGRGRGEFTNPQGVCCTRDGKIVIADSNNQCVQVFSSANGEFRLRFGARGRSPGQMQRPTGVTVLPNGNYVVADYENKWVSIYDAYGKYVSRLGIGKLLGPKGVTVDKNGHIIVVDNKGKYKVLSFIQTPLIYSLIFFVLHDHIICKQDKYHLPVHSLNIYKTHCALTECSEGAFQR